MLKKRLHILNYRVSGRGRPVVFLHGFLESITMWSFLKPFAGIQSIFVDLPGHGKSELNEELELSMTSIAESISHLLDELGIESYDVIGHSMGGYVALEMKRVDHRCHKLILLNSNFWEDNSLKKVDRRRVAELVQTKREAFVNTAIPNLFMDAEEQTIHVEALLKEALQISTVAIARSSLAMSERRDNTSVITDHVDDVLIIQGQFDAIVSQKMMREKIKTFNVSLREIPSGHMAHIEQSRQVEDAITEFLR